MHVETKHIATGAVMTVLLALFLFWQGDADGMDQQAVQMEQGAPDSVRQSRASAVQWRPGASTSAVGNWLRLAGLA